MTQAFNLSQLANKVNSSGQLDTTTGLVNATPVSVGGTGASSLTANSVLLGNGTNAIQTVSPSTSGNVLMSNGTTWQSSAFAKIPDMQVFTSSGTFTVPSGVTRVKVTVTGAGGGGVRSGGGAGGTAIEVISGLTAGTNIAVTVGTGGSGTSSGGTSSFGSFCSATGGGGGNSGNQVLGGTGGTASGGNINIQGGTGGGYRDDSFVNYLGGSAGASAWGGGAGYGANGVGSNGTAYGSGGGGGNTSQTAGANGIVVIEY